MSGMNRGLSREKLIKISDTIRTNNLHKKELNFKIVIIGEFGVGKYVHSFIITAYSHNMTCFIEKIIKL